MRVTSVLEESVQICGCHGNKTFFFFSGYFIGVGGFVPFGKRSTGKSKKGSERSGYEANFVRQSTSFAKQRTSNKN